MSPVDYGIPGRPVGGKRAPSRGPVLRMASFLTGILPDTPPAVDNGAGVTWGLDRNDSIGDCVVAGWDNFRRTVTRLLTGVEVDTPWTQVLAWYRTQNPDFDPDGDPSTTGPGSPADGGMDMQTFLAYLVRTGVILGFAAFDPKDDAELRAAVWLFYGAYLGANLQQAQQAQTDRGLWDYVPGSPDWGGHCIMAPKYTADGRVVVVTWALEVATTKSWRAHCLDEAYVILTRELVDHAGFRAGFDLAKYAQAWEAITGRAFPVAVTPPAPVPVPAGGLDGAGKVLAAWLTSPAGRTWVNGKHLGGNAAAAGALRAWAKTEGIL